jgi:hypothetical protein
LSTIYSSRAATVNGAIGASPPSDAGPAMNPPGSQALHARPRTAIVVGGVVLLASIGLVVVTGLLSTWPSNAGASRCTDVAARQGLDFRGDYELTPSGLDSTGAMMFRNMGNGAAVADVFGDGSLDVLLLGQRGHPNRLFRNQLATAGTPTFVDVTDAAGLASEGSSRTAAFADLDGDGRLDLVVLNDWDGAALGSPSKLYRNEGDGTFTDVTTGSGFAPVGYLVGGLSLADYDHDGRLDLFVTYWTMELAGDPALDPMRVKGRFPGENRLYRNLGDMRFQDVTGDVHLGQTTADSFSTVFADFTGDGWPDLYVAVDHRADQFYENLGGTFRLASEEHGIGHVGNDMGLAVTDLENDGLLDLYSTNITDPNVQFGTGAGNTLLLAHRAADGTVTYSDDAKAAGVRDTGWGWGTAFVDLDLDGRQDLFAVQGMHEFIGQQSPELRARTARLFRGTATGFEPAPKEGCDIGGDQRALIPLDFDRDGAPDLLITQVAGPTVLLQNGTTGQHWLTVDLSRAGAQAAGARVTVTRAGTRTTQVAVYGGSYLAGMPMELYFGLGPSAAADGVTVTWADGTVSDLGPMAGDRIVHVTPAGVE